MLAASLGEIEIASVRGWTSITASVRDSSEFYGLLDRLEDFALWVVSVNELADPGAGPAGGSLAGRQRREAGADPRAGSAGGPGRTAEAWLAGAAEHDLAVLETALSLAEDTGGTLGLDMRSRPLVRLAGLVAMGAGDMSSAYRRQVIEALDRGVTIDEIAGVLMALLPTAGTARVTAAASPIRTALDRVLP